ncbi:DUF2474 domain-containing protein [Nguyenibacter vanlangensis]|nr:DUF2474 domain-containing protein [Nguyenibacter vanlangensis]
MTRTEGIAMRRPWMKRLGWLVAIWGASVLALGVLATLMHLLMAAAGMVG